MAEEVLIGVLGDAEALSDGAVCAVEYSANVVGEILIDSSRHSSSSASSVSFRVGSTIRWSTLCVISSCDVLLDCVPNASRIAILLGSRAADDNLDQVLKSKDFGGALYSKPNTNPEPSSVGLAGLLVLVDGAPFVRGRRLGYCGMNPKLKDGSGFCSERSGDAIGFHISEFGGWLKIRGVPSLDFFIDGRHTGGLVLTDGVYRSGPGSDCWLDACVGGSGNDSPGADAWSTFWIERSL